MAKVLNSPFVMGVTQGLNLALRNFLPKRPKQSIFAAARKLQINHSVMEAIKALIFHQYLYIMRKKVILLGVVARLLEIHRIAMVHIKNYNFIIIFCLIISLSNQGCENKYPEGTNIKIEVDDGLDHLFFLPNESCIFQCLLIN